MVIGVEPWAPTTVSRLTNLLRRRRVSVAHAAETFHREAEEALATIDLSDLIDNETSTTGEDSLLLALKADAALREIDDALERIATGTYGYCEICQSRIPLKRLRALPTARVCLDCRLIRG